MTAHDSDFPAANLGAARPASAEELTELDGDRTETADLPGKPRAYLLVVQKDRSEVVEVPASEEVLLGRGTEATLTLDDSRVSRRHAKLYWQAGELVLEDLGSRNATTVNGDVVSGAKRNLRGGDCIRIAGFEVRVALLAAPVEGSASAQESVDGIVVADESMARTFGFARRVARASTTVLVLGETGVGKEVVASRIHAWSQRSARRFVRVNCAALPENLVESELFGHERGAFTGADKRKIGFAEAAHEGTLFLDEIGELSLPVQAKLLSMLENRAVVRLGSTVETPVDVRVIAATHRNLMKEVEAGRFREDLYYRIGVVVIRVPPLRQRPSEISLLAKLFAKRFGENLGWHEPSIAADAMSALSGHAWPGNVRELRNAIEHAMLLTEDGVVRSENLPETINSLNSAVFDDAPPSSGEPASALLDPKAKQKGVKAALAAVERAAIEEALRAGNGNRTHAALALGISLRSLLYKVEKYGLNR